MEFDLTVKEPAMIHVYRSLHEIVAAGERARALDCVRPLTSGETFDQTLRLALSGDEKRAGDAQVLLEDIERLDSGEPLNAWGNAPFGAYPVVPEYLSGRPDCMRAIVETPECTPTSIYACTSASAGITPDRMTKRGIAILALVLRLQQLRPVQLFIVEEGGHRDDGAFIQVLPIHSQPLSLAHACYCLTSPGFTMNLFYAAPAGLGTGGNGYNWPSAKSSDSARWTAWMRNYLHLGPGDLYIPATYWDDPEVQQMCNEPVAWINNRLAALNNSD